MNNKPYLTEEERSVIITYHTDYFDFKGRTDCSGGIEVTPLYKYNEEILCSATAQFISNFILWTFPRLNGFSGISTIKFNIKELIIVT
jgi:hypothetical protein